MARLTLLLLILASPTQEKIEPKEHLKRLIEGTKKEQERAGVELVKAGKKARSLLKRAHSKNKNDPEIQKRIESVALRIDAESDKKIERVGEVEVQVGSNDFKIRHLPTVKQDKLVLQIPLKFINDSKKEVDFVLKKAVFYTFRKKTPLVVIGRGGKNFKWTVPPDELHDRSYNGVLSPKWEEGTLGVVALRFEVSGKTFTLRSDVAAVETADD